MSTADLYQQITDLPWVTLQLPRAQIERATTLDDTRPLLRGVYWTGRRYVASDGFILAAVLPDSGCNIFRAGLEEAPAWISPEAIEALRSGEGSREGSRIAVLPEDPGRINHNLISLAGRQQFIRFSSGRYPDYEEIFPAPGHVVRVGEIDLRDVRDAAESLRRWTGSSRLLKDQISEASVAECANAKKGWLNFFANAWDRPRQDEPWLVVTFLNSNPGADPREMPAARQRLIRQIAVKDMDEAAIRALPQHEASASGWRFLTTLDADKLWDLARSIREPFSGPDDRKHRYPVTLYAHKKFGPARLVCESGDGAIMPVHSDNMKTRPHC